VAAGSAGLAVLMLRHERKGGGEVGESGRGSSAFAGAVDVILQLKRPEGNTRRRCGCSRPSPASTRPRASWWSS
jgi:hypothetical protein